jgi:hypothetical protein
MAKYEKETVFMGKGIFGFYISVVILCAWGLYREFSLPLSLVLVIVCFIPLLFGKMKIAVSESDIGVAFGYIKAIKFTFKLNEILSAEPVTYNPLLNFGGWGIKCGRFRGERATCISLKGNKGLLLSLKEPIRPCLLKTTKVIIGTDEPEALAAAIR